MDSIEEEEQEEKFEELFDVGETVSNSNIYQFKILLLGPLLFGGVSQLTFVCFLVSRARLETASLPPYAWRPERKPKRSFRSSEWYERIYTRGTSPR
jgi:hypothetical protein